MWPSVVVCRATAVTTTVAALGEPCVSRDSRADDLIRAAVLAAHLLGISSFGGLDYRLSSGLRVVINDTVAWRSAVIAARYRRVRVPPLHHLGDQHALFGLGHPVLHRRSVLGSRPMWSRVVCTVFIGDADERDRQ